MITFVNNTELTKSDTAASETTLYLMDNRKGGINNEQFKKD